MLDNLPSFFHINISLFILLLAALAGAALAYYQYHRTIPPVSLRLRTFLAILRGLAIAGILVLVFSPEITAVWQIKEKPRMTVLIDRSASMGIREQGRQRLQRAAAAAEKLIAAVSGLVDISLFAFDADTVHLTDLQTDTTQMGTDISKALSSVIQVQSPPEEIVLLTDGNFTEGNNPLYLDLASKTRIFTVGLGDTVESPDLMITDVQTGKIIYQNQPTKVQAMILPRGIDKARVRLRLLKGTKILQAKEVQLGRRDEQRSVDFEFVPDETGPQQFKVEAMPLPEESFVINNTFSFSIDVLKGMIRVGLLSGKPGYESKFLRLILSAAKDIDLKTSVFNASGPYYLNQPASVVDSLDVLILENFPSPDRTESEALNILKMTASKRVPTLIILAECPSAQTLDVIKKLFPLTILQNNPNPELTQVHLTTDGRFLPLLSVFRNEAEEKKFWMSNPPIIYKFLNVELDDKATTLLATYAPAQKTEQGKPVISAFSGKGVRSLLFLGSGFWRWDFVQAEERNFHDKWQQIIRNMIRWLASETANKNVILTTARKEHEIGRTVRLQTQVYDLSYKPVNDASIRMTINGPASSFEVESAFTGDGIYEASFIPLEAGDYTVQAVAWRNDVRIGEDRVKLPVLPVNQEFLETTQNKRLLKKLAADNGGQYVHEDQIEKIIPLIRTEPFRLEKKETIELWNRLPALLLIIGLLCLEWFIRKRKGLA